MIIIKLKDKTEYEMKVQSGISFQMYMNQLFEFGYFLDHEGKAHPYHMIEEVREE